MWRLSEEVRGGTHDRRADFLASESSMIRSRGHCNTMGTASTMACMAEALGMTLPGVAGTPAPDSRLLEAAHGTGKLAVRAGRGRPAAERGADPRLVPQRDRRAGRDRRLHQRGGAPAGHRRPGRRAS